MSSQPLVRTTYEDQTNTPRGGNTGRGESRVDMEQYYQLLEQIHGSGMHSWGIATGLAVSVVTNPPGLQISPGIGLDATGKHISLAAGGKAEVNASPAGPVASLADVSATGVTFPTPTNSAGDQYLTIEWRETFDDATWITSHGQTFQKLHTPWLRLQPLSTFPTPNSVTGQQLILGRVTLDASGTVTNLTPEYRRMTGLPVGSILLQKATVRYPAPNLALDSGQAGTIHVLTTGGLNGLDITVPNKSDEIHLERDDGGNFARVSLGAEQIVARQGTGTESVVIDTEAGSLTASGTITGGSISTSGGVTASSATVNGPISAGSITASGSMTASSATVNGPISARSLTASGAVTAGGATVNGPISASSITASGNVSGSSGIFGPSTWACTINGNLVVNGIVTKGGGGFKIDHPLDPANKYLSHSFVESPDMKNIYDGVAVLDEHGEAVVELPTWIEALNTQFRYQLTCLGGYAPVYIAEQVRDHRFKIAGGEPEMEVSWQLTGIRRDAWANAHRLRVEEDKPEEEQGCYLHPELYGASREQHVFAVRHPELAALLTVPEQGTEEER